MQTDSFQPLIDRDALDTVGALIRRLGFDALDAGPLRNARYLEPLAQLVVYLVRTVGYGPMGIHHEWPRTREVLVAHTGFEPVLPP